MAARFLRAAHAARRGLSDQTGHGPLSPSVWGLWTLQRPASGGQRGETRSETLRLAVDLFLARSAAVGWHDAVGGPRPAPAPDLW